MSERGVASRQRQRLSAVAVQVVAPTLLVAPLELAACVVAAATGAGVVAVAAAVSI